MKINEGREGITTSVLMLSTLWVFVAIAKFPF
jgi:hypothetical protein